MANFDNSCGHLDVPNEYDNHTEHLKILFELQKNTQENVYGYNFSNMSLKEIVDFWKWNHIAQTDEIMEQFSALGGIKDGIGSAAWKPWKKDNKKTDNMKISDLTPTDKKELFMEIADEFHFFLNKMMSINMTAEDLFNCFLSKNIENIRRQQNGY